MMNQEAIRAVVERNVQLLIARPARGHLTCATRARLGIPFLRRRKSGLIDGAADDARDLSAHLAAYLGRTRTRRYERAVLGVTMLPQPALGPC